ncbi:MAG: hypothetical protein OXL36_12105 [Bryobacterales bacterium]|nr:hypothetical protein [Bryobacterales bacterium]
MGKPLDLAGVLARDAALLRLARESASLIHPSDIKAAGNEVEKAVRDYFRRILPQPYYVTSGYLIDSEHRLSPQLDIIVSDGSNLPSLYATQDGTEYVPITSVYAIGEIKSTYYKSKGYLQKASQVLAAIAEMQRPLIKNTAFGGELRDETTIRDTMLGSTNRFLNQLFSFLFCVDAGDFQFKDVVDHLNDTRLSSCPSVTVLMNQGVLLRAKRRRDGRGIAWCRYPTEAASPDYDWVFAESMAPEGGSREGSGLAMLCGMLIEHLRNSHLEAASAYAYTQRLIGFRRSTLRWANRSPSSEPK